MIVTILVVMALVMSHVLGYITGFRHANEEYKEHLKALKLYLKERK